MTSASSDALDSSEGTGHAQRFFLACFFSIFATSSAFIVRAMVITEWGTTFNLTEAQKGAIFPGAALFPFAISIVLFSLFIDRLGYGKTMAFAVFAHLVGTIVTIAAQQGAAARPRAYQLLYFGTLITSLANGAVEAVANPVTATLFPRNKTHYLNILHAGWPGGLVAMGVVTLLMGTSVSWEWKVALVFIPTLLYGMLLIGQKFPVQERVAAGVSYTDMMREFGAAARSSSRGSSPWRRSPSIAVSAPDIAQGDAWDELNNFGPPDRRDHLRHRLLRRVQELRPADVRLPAAGHDPARDDRARRRWLGDRPDDARLRQVRRLAAGLHLRHHVRPAFLRRADRASHLAARIARDVRRRSRRSRSSSSRGVGANVALVIIAATLYGIGKSFFWPTTLGVVSEQFPKGGALTLSAMGGMGMIAVGVLGGPFLGTLVDKRMDANVAREAPAIHAIVADGEVHALRHALQEDRPGQGHKPCRPTSRTSSRKIQGETKQGTLATFAILPTIMFLCYLA